MAGVNRSTFLEEAEDAAIQKIARERKWSHSQTIAELVRESPLFVETMKDAPQEAEAQ